jgi:hypothetical protein
MIPETNGINSDLVLSGPKAAAIVPKLLAEFRRRLGSSDLNSSMRMDIGERVFLFIYLKLNYVNWIFYSMRKPCVQGSRTQIP